MCYVSKGVFGLFQTTPLPLVRNSKYFDIPPPNSTYDFLKHLDSLIMWQMVKTKHIFHQKYQSFTSKVNDLNYDCVLNSNTQSVSLYSLHLFSLCKNDPKTPS